jgi:hypothetical protein
MKNPTSTYLLGLKTSATALLSLFAMQGLSANSLFNYQFSDANNTYLQHATNASAANTGSEAGSWDLNFGPRVQNGNLNYGYTSSYSWTSVDDEAGNAGGQRKFTFDNAINSSTHSSYTLRIVLDKWDFRRSWDSAASAAGKGVQFSIMEQTSNADIATIFAQTSGVNGFQVASQATGSNGDITGAFAGAAGGTFNTDNAPALNRFSATGAILEISGDLTTGAWTSRASSNDGAEWKNLITSGTGLTSIAAIRFNSRNPAVGSWGGSAANLEVSGDYAMIDSMELTASAVPEPSTYVLLTALFALVFTIVRRRCS